MHQYNRVTGDLAFMLDQGAEVLVETARFWMELGFFSERRGGRFCINGVTGPDEYTTVVDNNAYTNLMAKENLEIAVRVVEWLQGADPEAHAALARVDRADGGEVEDWRRAAELMYVPRHEELGIVLQDEHFLERKRWDFDGTPPSSYPLLLHYHPLELYRHQVIKQTDVVLATYLADDAVHRGGDAAHVRLLRPAHDRRLDAVGLRPERHRLRGRLPRRRARVLPRRAAPSTCSTRTATPRDGIHIASCGGTWLALVAGFGGLRDSDGAGRASRRGCPAEWERLRFRVQVRGQLIEVDMTPRGDDLPAARGQRAS